MILGSSNSKEYIWNLYLDNNTKISDYTIKNYSINKKFAFEKSKIHNPSYYLDIKYKMFKYGKYLIKAEIGENDNIYILLFAFDNVNRKCENVENNIEIIETFLEKKFKISKQFCYTYSISLQEINIVTILVNYIHSNSNSLCVLDDLNDNVMFNKLWGIKNNYDSDNNYVLNLNTTSFSNNKNYVNGMTYSRNTCNNKNITLHLTAKYFPNNKCNQNMIASCYSKSNHLILLCAGGNEISINIVLKSEKPMNYLLKIINNLVNCAITYKINKENNNKINKNFVVLNYQRNIHQLELEILILFIYQVKHYEKLKKKWIIFFH